MDSNGAQIPPQTGVEATVPTIQQGEPSGSKGTNPKLRKRTKTGCLTCRKRRIKCGEERPICNNCIKSRRHCDGYNQRVIFKPPIGDWPIPQNGGTNTLLYHTSMLPGAHQVHARAEHFQTTEVPLTPLQPRSGFESSSEAIRTTDMRGTVSAEQFGARGPLYGASSFSPQGVTIPQVQTLDAVPVVRSRDDMLHFTSQWTSQSSPVQYQHHDPAGTTFGWGARSSNDQAHFQVQTPSYPRFTSHAAYQNAFQILQPQVFAPAHPIAYNEETFSIDPPHPAQSIDEYGRPLAKKVESGVVEGENDTPANTATKQRLDSRASQPRHILQQPPEDEPVSGQSFSAPDQVLLQTPVTSQQVSSGQFSPVSAFTYGGPSQLLDEAAVEIEDDDYYDVQSDEEMDDAIVEQSLLPMDGKQRDFGMILALHRASTSETSMRRYDTFIYEGILDSYRAEWVANPLRNPNTARVFAHFVHATGPALSIYERNPRNASAFFGESPMPSSQQSLWTYTMPMMALNHQGLLHAMLALASLHIARLQGASQTPSYKHYAYALKRIHHCVGHPKKRHMVTTLAASLLLGHYEVMTADHMKWSSHLIGARQLLLEIDFPRITSEIRRVKAEQEAYERNFAYHNPEVGFSQRDLAPLSKDIKMAVDEGLVSTLIGRKLRYDEYGRIIEEPHTKKPSSSKPQQVDLGKYEILQDLFWWYCKHDAYHSIISGNPLLMDYSRWSDCPPRACMGRRDAVYGAHDHIFLLLGRIADFAPRDRKRKLKTLAASGGIWRPPPGMPAGPGAGAAATRPPMCNPAAAPHLSNPATSPQGSQGPPPRFEAQQMPRQQQQSPAGPPPQMPPFYGMAPVSPETRMPSSYSTNKPHSPISPATSKQEDEMDLAAATASALEEWNQIRAALHVFASHLGPDYQPLSPEYYQPLASPFGDALQYHSYDIGVIWGLYYMCHIILIRSHPSMPPAAMVAASVAAAQTAHFAQEIGRIAAGIMPTPQQNQPLNPSLGAAMTEISLPLFFAGVQYVDAEQRAWLVSRLLDTDARTGWASTGMIARGCETAWEKAAAMGRGPPYQRYKSAETIQHQDERISRRRGHFSGEPPRELSDRRFIHVNPATRLHWAIGVLSAEEDIRSPEGS